MFKKTLFNISMLGSVVVIVGVGCTATQAPTPSGEMATLRLLASANQRHESNQYQRVLDETCATDDQEQVVVKFSPISKVTEDIQIPAGEAVYLLARHDSRSQGRKEHGSLSIKTLSCRNLVRFTPQAGGLYEMQQVKTSPDTCEAKVVDMGTGQRPSDYAFFPIPDTCP